jgi:hypothetical protein
MGSVPPARMGNLQEGVSTAVFCELWFGDWYQTNRQSRVHKCPPPLGSPRFARGTAHGFGSPCLQGEPEGGGFNYCFL